MSMNYHTGHCHYRGWTLVERGRFLFACKDNTNIYRRVCKADTEDNYRIAAFRAVVDREEDGD